MEGMSYGRHTDKTRVGNQAPPPFVCSPPFPPGFSPFYPFTSSSQAATQHTQNNSQPSLVTPVRSFRSPNNNVETTHLKVQLWRESKIPKSVAHLWL
ncbi:hypothetical protein HID58_046478 [Brassica napus]|uniref:Uncharacterized protein n=1 Tax=Brassica napus TaxID=3708 RepID=A0ABQ8AWI4_BRANA|nr:hypothetical protein HID58_046478 [Brassica napus]